MTLLITLSAAIAATALWYKKAPDDTMRVSTLCFLYWGGALMWMVDAFFAYLEEGAAYFVPSLQDMVNDGFLGLAVVVFGLFIWICVLLLKDPKGVLKKII